MRMTVRAKGLDGMRARFARLRGAAEPTLRETLREYGELIEDNAKENIATGPKTGIVYKRYNPPRVIQSSAPGQSPADDLGNLYASISFSGVTGNIATGLRATVGSALAYAAMLEFGTRKMAARPYMLPAYNEARAALAGRALRTNFRRYWK